jgi:hypothetical protein
MSLREVSSVLYYNASSVSRFLTGRRIPRWDFVIELARSAEQSTGEPLTADFVGYLHEAWAGALRVSDPTQYEIESLRTQLEEANRRLADLGE